MSTKVDFEASIRLRPKMDEALGWAVYFQGLYGVTARIDTRFRRPMPIGTRVMIKAWTIDRRRRIATARAEVGLKERIKR